MQKIYLYDILFLVNNCQKKEQLSQKEIKTLLLVYGKILVAKSFTIYINKGTKSLYLVKIYFFDFHIILDKKLG